jgi:hypothetical protein
VTIAGIEIRVACGKNIDVFFLSCCAENQSRISLKQMLLSMNVASPCNLSQKLSVLTGIFGGLN